MKIGDYNGERSSKKLMRPNLRALFVSLVALVYLFAFSPALATTPNPPTILNPNVFSQDSTPRVDGESGALTQKINLDIPPGRTGLQPNLSLNYNSQDTSEDGIVGYGWSLSIPYIERLNKTGSENIYGPAAYFTSSFVGELAIASPAATWSPISVLVVAGGGGGGSQGGGGGGGGVVYNSSYGITAGT